MTYVDTAKNQHSVQPDININSCNSFKCICSSKITLSRLNEFRNTKRHVEACCNRLQALLMCAKYTEYKHEIASIYLSLDVVIFR